MVRQDGTACDEKTALFVVILASFVENRGPAALCNSTFPPASANINRAGRKTSICFLFLHFHDVAAHRGHDVRIKQDGDMFKTASPRAQAALLSTQSPRSLTPRLARYPPHYTAFCPVGFL